MRVRGAGPAAAAAGPGGLPGFAPDPDYAPVPVPRAGRGAAAAADERVVVVRGTLEEGGEEALRRDPRVVAVWSDARIEGFAGPCGTPDCNNRPLGAKGDLSGLAPYLGADRLWAEGIRGRGIVVAIVDGGVRRADVPALLDGWAPEGALPWGEADPRDEHGTMCAIDALAVCPEAGILDVGILKSPGDTAGLLSDAIAAYRWAIERRASDGSPHVLSNSWGMYMESWGPDYARDPDHPFTRVVLEAIGAGILVAFAAGNCGGQCMFPDRRCGSDLGPGRGIWGANGHPLVLTVGAANMRDEWVGYSSEGPAALDDRKPDVCAPSHFAGYTRNDSGTSAATPVAAGALALLAQAVPGVRQAEAKAALEETARDICAPGWDPQSGHGVIRVDAALARLREARVPRAAEAVPR
jgi:subtilisin family serine protease